MGPSPLSASRRRRQSGRKHLLRYEGRADMPSNGRPSEALDPGGLDEIEVAECWQLLGTQAVGRVAVIVGHYPLVFPVNYAVDDKAILYRTGTGTKLQSIHRSNVTFEVDSI